MENKNLFDVIIIGGSYAGLSAAMALGRSLRKTLVIDSGLPCNRQTPHSHNFLTHDGKPPKEIAAAAKSQVEKYDTIKFYDGLATKGLKTEEGFVIETQSGETFKSKKLILAAGIKDELLPIPGFSECWGISVIHCPYCHGYEYRSQTTGILANGDAAMHLAGLARNLTKELMVFTNGKSALSNEQENKLMRHGISLIETEIAAIEHKNGYIQNLRLKDGSKAALSALYAKVPFTQNSDIPAALGCEFTESGHLKVDGFQASTVSGVFACGDNSSMMRSVAFAVAAGNLAGAAANMELTAEQF